MGESEKVGSENDKHAWRRKPRKFAPKSRLGCKTCKCQSTGRKCDGYGDNPETTNPGDSSAESSVTSEAGDSIQPVVTCQQRHWLAQYSDPVQNRIGPLTILSCTGPTQSLAMYFFEYVSIKHLNEFRPSDAWRKSLMLYAQTVPAVQYAATALALVHRDHLDYGLTDCVNQLQASKGRLSFDAPLFYYNRAIQLLLDQQRRGEADTSAITLLVCYLFTCFDLLAGNYVQATNHLLGGVELARNFEQTKRWDGHDYPSSHTLMTQVIEQINRLDMQAIILLINWNPAITPQSLLAWIPTPDDAFTSVDQAADHLQILMARVMRHRNKPVFDSGYMTESYSEVRFVLDTHLDRWRRLFKRSLQHASSRGLDLESHPSTPLLRLQYRIMRILLDTEPKDAEMEYDTFLPQFQEAMILAHQVAANHSVFSDAKPTFTPEIGFLPVLWIIGAKCRDPSVRSEVLGILRRQSMREAVWDSNITAIALVKLIEIEQGGSSQGVTVEHMHQIPVHRRVENLDCFHCPGTEPRLDYTYTLTGSEKTYTGTIPL